MTFRKYSPVYIILFFSLASCEHVIDVELKSSEPAFVVEASINRDSVCHVRLSQTDSYFSTGEPRYIPDAIITLTDGTLSEKLNYKGDGYYFGSDITGTEEKTYGIEITYNKKIYKGLSYMTKKTDIISVHFSKSDSRDILNPDGKTIFTLTTEFIDNPVINNFYLIRFLSGDRMIENYYLLTEHSNVGGSLENTHDTLSFSESVFYDGGEVEVQLFSIDESVYNYFIQLNDVLFWKRRIIPPGQYNPISNISNGVMGYFAAWSYDSKRIKLE